MNLPYCAEYAKTDLSSCRRCENRIAKETLRLAVIVQAPDFDRKIPNWYHFSCFFDEQRIKTVGDIDNFESLRWADQELIKSQISGGCSASTNGISNGTSVGKSGKKTSKRKAENNSADFTIEYSKSGPATCRGCRTDIVEQDIRVYKKDCGSNKENNGDSDSCHLECFSKVRQELEFWESGDKLAGFQNLKKEDQYRVIEMLPPMNSVKIKKESEHVDGASPPEKMEIDDDNVIKEQNQKIFYYYDHLKQLPRKQLVILLEFNEQNVTPPKGDDKILKVLSDAMTFGALLPCKECEHGQLEFRSGVGYVCTNSAEWVQCATVTRDPERKPFLVPEELKQNYDFLASYEYKPQKRIIQGNKPSVPSADVPDASNAVNNILNPGKYKSNLPAEVKLEVQDGVAVDPRSELVDVAHVYRFNEDFYHASLLLTDIQEGYNSYYFLQVLESNDKDKYWVFRAWGRTGTDIGGTKTEEMGSRDAAIAEFEALFKQKTGNEWGNKANFLKVPNKKYLVDISFENNLIDGSSTLSEPVQNLITLIFDEKTMKNVMMEFQLDIDKMPLGILSKEQMRKAFDVLIELQNCVSASTDGSNEKKIIALTNQFYTLIPHNFGIDDPPLLNNLDIIKRKYEMLDELKMMKIAYSIRKDVESENKTGPMIDLCYLKLKANIDPLNKESEEYKTIELYFKNTSTKCNFDIEEIYKINRHGEDERYCPFEKLNNRKLLWHGSRITNFVGLLSEGLRITPPEVQLSGGLFGKGIYFADMVSKSAKYCYLNPQDTTGLMLLCQVALGDMYERHKPERIVKLPSGKHSVKGIGETEPDPDQFYTREDDVVIPFGKEKPTHHEEAWLPYNEYIVYNEAQVKVEYVVQFSRRRNVR